MAESEGNEAMTDRDDRNDKFWRAASDACRRASRPTCRIVLRRLWHRLFRRGQCSRRCIWYSFHRRCCENSRSPFYRRILDGDGGCREFERFRINREAT